MSSTNLINVELNDYSKYNLLQQMIASAIVEEMNISNSDFITLTKTEGLKLANNAAKRFLNKIKNNQQ